MVSLSVDSAKGRAVQVRAERTRSLLVVAAAEAFGRHGFRGATVGEIAAAAGVSTGALHFHFPTKGDLGAAVQAAGCGKLADIGARLESRRSHPVQELIDLSQIVLEWLARDVTVRVAVRMWHQLPPAVGGAPDFCGDWLERIGALALMTERAGVLCEGRAASSVAASVAGAMVGAELLAGAGGPCRSVAQVAECWRLLLPGLVGEAAAAGLNPYGSLRLGAGAVGPRA
ncbi:TetR family transcriptional regulator [Kitasatospora sp. GAS1066B]|uniref:TetR family transcriptional regulator n=1 Tax=Kitasatospora sp. GAS1066B TaxID=3156271 RepID=UPI0035115F86